MSAVPLAALLGATSAEHKPFTFVEHIPVLKDLPENTVTLGLVVVLLIAAAAWIRPLLVSTGHPKKAGAFAHVVLLAVRALRNFLRGLIGHDGDKYVPFIGTLFLLILVSNLLGLVPGFLPPTRVFATNMGLALISFITYNAVGVKAHGIKYVKQFMGPVIYIAPLMLIIEAFSHFVRPVTLTIRLMANMTADHMAFETISGLVPLVLPVVMLLLGTLVSIIQAFVFALLSAVYIGLAASHEH